MYGSESVKLTAYSQIVSRLRISGALPLLPLYDVRYLFTAVGFPSDGSGQCAFPHISRTAKTFIYLFIFRFYALNIPYILESNPRPFYSFRGLKNQMPIRIAVVSWILEK